MKKTDHANTMIILDSNITTYKTHLPKNFIRKLSHRSIQTPLRKVLFSYFQSLISSDLLLQAEVTQYTEKELLNGVKLKYEQEQIKVGPLGEENEEEIWLNVVKLSMEFPFELIRKQWLYFITPVINIEDYCGYDSFLLTKTTSHRFTKLLLSHLRTVHSLVMKPLSLTTDQSLSILNFILDNVSEQEWRKYLGEEVNLEFDLNGTLQSGGLGKVEIGVGLEDLRALGGVVRQDQEQYQVAVPTQEEASHGETPTGEENGLITGINGKSEDPTTSIVDAAEQQDMTEATETNHSEAVMTQEHNIFTQQIPFDTQDTQVDDNKSDDELSTVLQGKEETSVVNQRIENQENSEQTQSAPQVDDQLGEANVEEEELPQLNHPNYPKALTPPLSNLILHISDTLTLVATKLQIRKISTDMITFSSTGRFFFRRGMLPAKVKRRVRNNWAAVAALGAEGVGVSAVEVMGFVWWCWFHGENEKQKGAAEDG